MRTRVEALKTVDLTMVFASRSRYTAPLHTGPNAFSRVCGSCADRLDAADNGGEVAMTTPTACDMLAFEGTTVHRNLSTAALVEAALDRGEGVLAANGALACDTGAKTGRSPKDKFLEDTPGIHDTIAWGNVNRPVTPEVFSTLEQRALDYLSKKDELYRFDGYAGADERYRIKVSVVTEEA